MKKYIIVDGNEACANIAYYFSEVAEIYPITPSSSMAELTDQWAQTGKLNIFDMPVKVSQLQSEAGVSGAIHGTLAAGVLANTFTSSQGLLLMIPNMFKIAGELLPTVFHVAARAVSTHALSIFAEHSDVMATRSTGFSMIASSSVQEAQDMALVAHLSTLKTSVPFIHFFDGFRTSHEIQKIEEITKEQILKLVPFDKIEESKQRGLNPSHPHQQGTAQNPDIFFQNKEAQNLVYNKVFDAVNQTMQEVSDLTGRKYSPFEYYGSPKATKVVVLMGSSAQTAQETLENLEGDYGVLNVRLLRPFNSKAFVNALPESVKLISVLDRTKENGANYEPLAQDVISAINEQNKHIKVVGGRYGLGSKDFTPTCVKAVFDNMEQKTPKDHFTVGIEDDVTFTSLEMDEAFDNNLQNYTCKFYGLGADGTVSANKNSIKIIGQETNQNVQGYFEYDSKKSGSLTVSHLRVSDKKIQSTYKVKNADFIAIHSFNFVARYSILKALKQGGSVLINTAYNKNQINSKLPNFFKEELINKNAKLFVINAQKIANELGLKNKINIIMQTAFFKLTQIIDFEEAKLKIKKAISNTYSKKGEQIIELNKKAVDMADKFVQQINVADLTINTSDVKQNKVDDKYYNDFVNPINSHKGNNLKVSAFNADGRVPTNTSRFEKRNIASRLPEWKAENCIQCGMCTLSCPHAAIRSVIVKDDDLKEAPDGFVTVAAFGAGNAKYKIQISPEDCTGCGVCADVCPSIKKSLVMKDANELLEKEKINYEFFEKLKNIQTAFNKHTIKGLQFEKPYFEFNSACAGCGETPYIKIATQLFGENMLIANATGCSSIYGGSSPACPYSKNEKGYGPSWASSLLEDNAEFGLGMAYAMQVEKAKLIKNFEEIQENIQNAELKTLVNNWLEDPNAFSNNDAEQLIKLLANEPDSKHKGLIIKAKDYIAKKSVWIIGGDGWAYDIGYGGIDHVLASGQNVNILVLDNEGYSNTGGQLSKSTPRGSFVKFAFGGKETKKKNLAALALTGKNAYVASIGLGANMQQTINAFKEAEEFDGPSIIIAYSPCVSHGYDLEYSQTQIKNAVRAGYWNLFRFNPHQNKFNLDSKEPVQNFEEFLLSENRYSAIFKRNPEKAKQLFELNQKDAKERHSFLVKFKENLEN